MSVKNLEKLIKEHSIDIAQLVKKAGLSENDFIDLYNINLDETVRVFTLARLEKALKEIVSESANSSIEVGNLTIKELQMLSEYRRLNETGKTMIRRVISSEWAKQVWVES